MERAEDVRRFEREVAMQNALELPSRMLAPEDAQRLSPLAGVEGVLAAALCPRAGLATPEAAVQGYAAGARRHGARIRSRCAVTGIDLERGRVRRVLSEAGWVGADPPRFGPARWSAG